MPWVLGWALAALQSATPSSSLLATGLAVAAAGLLAVLLAVARLPGGHPTPPRPCGAAPDRPGRRRSSAFPRPVAVALGGVTALPLDLARSSVRTFVAPPLSRVPVSRIPAEGFPAMLAFFPLDAVVGAAHIAIEGLAAPLTPVAGGFAGAAAIVLFTIAVRLLISPLTYVQARGERRRTALAPEVAELRRRHAADPVRLASETLALQRSAGAGPAAGCLPGLLQTPFFMVMYRLVSAPGAGVVHGLLAGSVAGVRSPRGSPPERQAPS
jgi:hypothetical protein